MPQRQAESLLLTSSQKVGIVGAAILAALVVGDVYFLVRAARYRELLSTFECSALQAGVPTPCGPDQLRITITPDHSLGGGNVVIRQSDRVLLLLPYDYVDNTLRTHIGVRQDAAGPRVVVYDGTRDPMHPIAAVYGFDGTSLTATAAEAEDLDLLAAMAAHDDAGTFNQWVVYYMARLPVLILVTLLWVPFGAAAVADTFPRQRHN
jgi:hypothetical protein